MAAFLCLSLILPGPAHALRMAQPESNEKLAGLEERLSPVPAFLQAIGAIPVESVRDVDGRQDNRLFFVRSKPDLASLRRFLNSRRREYGIYAFVVNGKPYLLVQAEKKGRLTGIDDVLARAIRREGAEISRMVAIHNHDRGRAYPSWPDFIYDIRQNYKAKTRVQDFVYSRTGRLLEFGNHRSTKDRGVPRVRIRTWGNEEKTAGVQWIPWRVARTVPGLDSLETYLTVFIRKKSILRLDMDDEKGHWIQWDRGVTLESLLADVGVLALAAGLEEPPASAQRAVLSGYPESVEFLNGLAVIHDSLSWDEVKSFLEKSVQRLSLRMIDPRYESEGSWADLELPAKPSEADLTEPLYLLASSQRYAILQGKRKTWILARAMLLRESNPADIRHWRFLLQEVARTKPEFRGSALWQLQQRFPAGEINMRVSINRRNGPLALFSIPGPQGPKKIYASLPSRYQGQVVRLVPAVDEKGSLWIDFIQSDPSVTFRRTRWNSDRLAMEHPESPAQEELRVIPEAVNPRRFPAVDQGRIYAFSELSAVTRVPRPVLDRLKKRGFIYQYPQGNVSGKMVLAMADISKKLYRTEYPLYALRDFLGVSYSSVRDLVFSEKMEAQVIHRPGEQERLGRGQALELVLAARLQGKIQAEVGGVIPSRQFRRELRLAPEQIDRWANSAGSVPWYDGYPLWVSFDGERWVTGKGYAGLKKELKNVRDRLGPGKVFLHDAVQERFQADSKGRMHGRQNQALRAVLELGLKYKTVAHPLQAVRPAFAVSKADLPVIWKEMDSPSQNNIRQIRAGRLYSVETAGRIFRRAPASIQRWISTEKKLPAETLFGMRWIRGRDLRKFLRSSTAGLAAASRRAGLEEDDEDAPSVPVFRGAHFTALEWIPLLSGYLQQVAREKKRPLQVQMAGPKGREGILLPLPGGATDPSERGARSKDWDLDTFRTALRRIGVDPENHQESWTVTLDEMGGELHFRFAPREPGGASSLGLSVSVADDFEEKSENTENRAQNEWGLFSWGDTEPDWIGEIPWEGPETLYRGSLQELVGWLGNQSVSDWREVRGISRIEIVFPDNLLKIKRKTHQIDENTDLRWIAERMKEELIPLAGADAVYEAVLVQDRVRIRPAAAGSEESTRDELEEEPFEPQWLIPSFVSEAEQIQNAAEMDAQTKRQPLAFPKWSRWKLEHIPGNRVGVFARDPSTKELLGFIIYEWHLDIEEEDLQGVEFQVLNLAVLPEGREKGADRWLINRVSETAQRKFGDYRGVPIDIRVDLHPDASEMIALFLDRLEFLSSGWMDSSPVQDNRPAFRVHLSFDIGAGLEEGRGYVLVEGVGLVAPSDLPEQSYYAVAVGTEQAAALIQSSRDPLRIIAVATSREEASALAALRIPGDQIIWAGDWPTLEAAKNYAVRLGREWLAGLGGLRVSVLEVTARTAQGILAQLQELLPSAWQTARPITTEDARQALELEA